MAYIEVNNPGAVGVIRDIAPHRLPNEALSDGKNIRMQEGAVYKFLGHDAVYDPPSGVPYWLLQAFSEGELFWIYPSLTAAFVTDGVVHKDITRASGPYTAEVDTKWTGGNYQGVPVLNNGVNIPQYWDRNFLTPGLLQDLPNWPTTLRAKILRPFKSFLVAADVTESGVRFEDVIRWSHPASPGGLPISWDPTDPTRDAGRVSVAEVSPGPIREMLALGSSLFIYKETGTFKADFVGGRFVLAFKPVFPNLGTIGTDCVAQFDEGSKHLVFTPEFELVIHDGITTKTVSKDRWTKFIRNNISENFFRRSYIVPHFGEREMWVCFPTQDATYPDIALVWNTQDNTFGVRDIPQGAYATWGLVDTGADDTIIDTGIFSEDAMDFVGATFDQRAAGAQTGRILFAGTVNTKLFRADVTNTFNGVNVNAYAERRGLGIIGRRPDGTPKVDFTKRKIVQAVYPKVVGGPVQISILSQEEIDGPVNIAGPVAFDPLTQSRIDFAVSGRFMGYRVESNANVDWRFEGMGFEVEPLGRY